jgi:hypothetical protein
MRLRERRGAREFAAALGWFAQTGCFGMVSSFDTGASRPGSTLSAGTRECLERSAGPRESASTHRRLPVGSAFPLAPKRRLSGVPSGLVPWGCCPPFGVRVSCRAQPSDRYAVQLGLFTPQKRRETTSPVDAVIGEYLTAELDDFRFTGPFQRLPWGGCLVGPPSDQRRSADLPAFPRGGCPRQKWELRSGVFRENPEN